MQYLLMIYTDEAVDDALSPEEMGALMESYGRFSAELEAAGAMVGGERLHPVATATSVRVRGGEATLTDGPFAETKEQLGGYYIIDVPGLDEAAMAKRLARAKRKIRDAGIAFAVPRATDVPDRLQDVLKTIELIFNEGYAQARAADLGVPGLVREALHLAGALTRLLPRDTEVMGLLALILFTDARRPARVDDRGRLVRLPDQDRSLWDPAAIGTARGILASAVRSGGAGPFVLQAALSAEHSTAKAAQDTRWGGEG